VRKVPESRSIETRRERTQILDRGEMIDGQPFGCAGRVCYEQRPWLSKLPRIQMQISLAITCTCALQCSDTA
jgi:hypothetical protein